MKTQFFVIGGSAKHVVSRREHRGSLRVAQKKGVNADPSNGCCGEKNVGRMNVGLAQQWMAKLKRSVG